MSLHSRGQATVEYILLVAFLLILASKMIGGFTDYMSGTVGNLGHVLTYNLSVGICKKDCYYPGFFNGKKQ